MSAILRDVFQERSADPAAVGQRGRLAAVHRRITRVHRRRVAAGAAAGVAVVLAVTAAMTAAGAVGGRGSSVAATGGAASGAATGGESVEGFPRYVQGARILTAASAAIGPDTSGTLTFQTAGTAD